MSEYRAENAPIKERTSNQENPSNSKSSLESDIPDFNDYVKRNITRFRKHGDRYWRTFHICQVIILVVSAATPLANAVIPSMITSSL